MNSSPSNDIPATLSTPTHDEIADCARALWNELGQPAGRDDAIWLEAEQMFIISRMRPNITAVSLSILAQPVTRQKTRADNKPSPH
jgi:hypothetical protein